MSRIPLPSTASSPFPSSDHRSGAISPVSQHTSRSDAPMSVSLAETRRKQSKKDEAIRRKIEVELARKRTISTTNHSSRGSGKRSGKHVATKGTVAALKPSPALTVPETITVSDASQLCAAKRTDCVLVVDEDEGLSGIFTAKDLAYRVTAEGIDPRNTPVSAIMTRNPMVTRDTTSATEALQLMVQRHFRHLPVCNEEGNVVGLLDITKVFHEALAKVERSSSASQKLYAALEGVQSEFGHGLGSNPQAAAMMAYVDALRDKTALPDLSTVIDVRSQPAVVNPKTTVRDAAKLMKDNRTTAVCVMESTGNGQSAGRIAGIFTSKDVVLRVIAAGLDPMRCSVVRVMTPHPDIAPPTMTVQDALKKMHNGHYLNLPVVEADGRLIAVVDVLKLTYATLEQMNSLSSGDSDDADGGPLWGRFFESIAANEETESAISGSHMRSLNTPPPPIRLSSHVQESPHSELFPGDSASVVDEGLSLKAEDFPPLPSETLDPTSSLGALRIHDSVPAEDGTYVFKFRTPSGRTHRFQARTDDAEHLRDIVGGKLEADPYFVKHVDSGHLDINPREFQLAYTDVDGDTVIISSNTDVQDAVNLARSAGADRVVLLVQPGKNWDDCKPLNPVQEANTAAMQILKHGDIPEEPSSASPAKAHAPGDDEIYGIPKDLLLPASIATLAAVIVGVFAISRLTRD